MKKARRKLSDLSLRELQEGLAWIEANIGAESKIAVLYRRAIARATIRERSALSAEPRDGGGRSDDG